jgi:protein SCO1/2
VKTFLLALALLGPCAWASELPVLGDVPAFSFTTALGTSFGKKELLGQVWVADFIFTRCGGQCPILSSKMQEIQKAFASSTGLKLVSFSVDPKHDTPAVLTKYAKKFKASDAWVFLTGPKGKIDELMTKGFHLAGGGGEEIMHSFRFVLVDKEGRLRGYYAVQEPDKFDALKADMKTLLQ